MRRALALMMTAGVSLAIAPRLAVAQTFLQTPIQRPAPPVRRPPARKPPVGIRAYAFYDWQTMAASQTFDAVTGSSSLHGFGGGFEVTNIVSRVFVRVAFARSSRDGQRVFIDNGEVFPLGIPLTVTLTPIEIGGGWRGTAGKRGLTGLYGGASVVFLNYAETSSGGTGADNTSKTFNGFSVFAGIDRTFHRHFFAGGEGQYRSVPNAIGEAGVSQIYNEKDLGGFGVRVLFGVRR